MSVVKNILTLLVLVIGLLVVSSLAQVEVSDVILGNDNLERDRTITTDVTIKNTAAQNETITLSFEGINARYLPQFITAGQPAASTKQLTLEAGASAVVTVQVFVPKDQDSGKLEIGKFKAQFGTSSASKPVYLHTRSLLEIKDLDIQVANEEARNVANGDKISKEPHPGETIEFNFLVKNTFTSQQDIDLENIELTVKIVDIDGGDDLEQTSEFDLPASDSQTETIEFVIPFDVEEEEYTVEIEVTGEDDNGAQHTTMWTLKLPVEKLRDAIIIQKAEFSPTVVTCEDSVPLLIRFKNIGTRTQQNVRYTINAPRLPFNVEKNDILLDRNINKKENEYSETLTIPLASNLATSKYNLRVDLYRELDELMDRKDLTLEKKACAEPVEATPQAEEPATETEETVLPTTTETAPTQIAPVLQQQVTGATTVSSVEIPFTESPRFIALLIAANVIVLIAIAGMTVALLRH